MAFREESLPADEHTERSFQVVGSRSRIIPLEQATLPLPLQNSDDLGCCPTSQRVPDILEIRIPQIRERPRIPQDCANILFRPVSGSCLATKQSCFCCQ